MKRTILLMFLACILATSLVAGCVSGDGDDNGDDVPATYGGTLESLLIPKESVPESFKENYATEHITDYTLVFGESVEASDVGFQDAYAASSVYVGEGDFGIFGEIVIRIDPAKLKETYDTYTEANITDEDDSWTELEVDQIGDRTFAAKISDEQSPSSMYQLVFTKKDIMVTVLMTGGEGTMDTLHAYATDIAATI